MFLKSFYFPLFLAAVYRKTLSACIRMQRVVNRSHTSLTKEVVKRPGADY